MPHNETYYFASDLTVKNYTFQKLNLPAPSQTSSGTDLQLSAQHRLIIRDELHCLFLKIFRKVYLCYLLKICLCTSRFCQFENLNHRINAAGRPGGMIIAIKHSFRVRGYKEMNISFTFRPGR